MGCSHLEGIKNRADGGCGLSEGEQQILDAAKLRLKQFTVFDETRTLTEWETAISEAVKPLGFVYHAHKQGDGYWFDGDRGIQLTHDLNPSRGGQFRWTLQWINGLRAATMFLDCRKRTPRTEAKEIVKRLAFLSQKDWQHHESWTIQDLSK